MIPLNKTCPVCGVGYCVPARFDEERREDHRSFYCPNGHSLSYQGESTKERTIRELGERVKKRDGMIARRDREIEGLRREVRSLRSRLAWARRRAADRRAA